VPRLDFVVPVAMKHVAAEFHLSKVCVRHFDPRSIGFSIQLSIEPKDPDLRKFNWEKNTTATPAL